MATTREDILALVRTYATDVGACQFASDAQYAQMQVAARATFAKIEAAVGELQRTPDDLPACIESWVLAKAASVRSWKAMSLKRIGRDEVTYEIELAIARLVKAGRLQRLNFGHGHVEYELRAVDQAAADKEA